MLYGQFFEAQDRQTLLACVAKQDAAGLESSSRNGEEVFYSNPPNAFQHVLGSSNRYGGLVFGNGDKVTQNLFT